MIKSIGKMFNGYRSVRKPSDILNNINQKEFMKNKKYVVSLAILIPANYEVEIEAENEQEAKELAIDDFRYNFDGNIQDMETNPSELLENFDVETGNGICIMD